MKVKKIKMNSKITDNSIIEIEKMAKDKENEILKSLILKNSYLILLLLWMAIIVGLKKIISYIFFI